MASRIEPKLFYPKPDIVQKDTCFHESMKFIIEIAQYFGFFPVQGLSEGNWKRLHFKWICYTTVYALIVLVAASIQAILCIWYTLWTGKISLFNINLFYVRGTFTCLAFIRLGRAWPKLMGEFSKVESILRNYPLTRLNIKRRLHILFNGIFIIAAIEYICSQVGHLLTAMECWNKLDEKSIKYFYTSVTFPHIFYIFPYSLVLALVIQVQSLIMTFGWNFLDAFIIFVSTSFSAKLVQFEEKIKLFKSQRIGSAKIWKHIREDYSQLCHLFKEFNKRLNGIIILSYITNVLLILWQLFSSLTQVRSGWFHLYYLGSLGLLVLRLFFVCIFGALFHEESVHLTNALTTIDSVLYNEEVERFIVEVDTSPLILSGGSFFYITKGLILELAGAIVTYELVLIQFSNQMLQNSSQNTSTCNIDTV